MSKESSHAGRYTKYKPEYDEQAFQLCKLGAIDTDLAAFFHVEEKTIHNWKKECNTFLQAVLEGKSICDFGVVKSLLQRANGFTAKESRKVYEVIDTPEGPKDKIKERTDIEKHYPPEVKAAIHWLNNRRSAEWRNKQDHTISEWTVIGPGAEEEEKYKPYGSD